MAEAGEDRSFLKSRAGRPWSLEWGYRVWILAPALFFLLFFALPIAKVVATSFLGDGISLAAYTALFSDITYVTVLLYTARVALVVTILTLLLSYPVAWVITGLRGNLLRLCLGMILVPFWTSAVIRSYAWLVIFQRRGVLNDMLLWLGVIDVPLRPLSNGVGMNVGMVHIMIPFMILPLLSTMWRIDHTLLRAAAVLGANPFRQFLHVYLPLSMPGVSAGSLLVFITSLGFFITPALLGGGQHMMAAVLIQQQASRLLNWPMASAIGTVLLVSTCLLYILYEKASHRLGGAWSTAG
jgi:ABC-type spermidine/putrescine transport system permease subunit I